MTFNDRNQIYRKSDPTYRNKKLKDSSCHDDIESSQNIKRKGTSLARPGFNRQNSFGINGKDYPSKRISVLETSKSEQNPHTGGARLMNFIKSTLNLSKSKSKSKLNLSDNRQSLYAHTTSSKSEENLEGFQSDRIYQFIKCRNLVLKADDNTIYIKEYNSNNEEVIKSLIVLTKECLVQTLHPSIANFQSYCFQIIKLEPTMDFNKPFQSEFSNKQSLPVSQIAKSSSYNSSFCSLKSIPIETDSINTIRCGSVTECNEWITKLKKHINPNYENEVRHEDLFKVWIQEAKNLIVKKRYYCEIKLDSILYGRTSVKAMKDMVFWGEEFEFKGLMNINTISISLYRMADNKKKHEKSELVAQINIPCSDFNDSTFVEKWYSPSPDIKLSSTNLRFSQSSKLVNVPRPEYDELMKNVIDCSPMLRIKGRYRPLEILPTIYYKSLSEFLINQCIPLVESLESHLKVKGKEDFVKILLLILENNNCQLEFLSDLVTIEVSKSDDNLILRGNTMASKAMECYMKMIGEKYLTSLLTELITNVIDQELDCEVDPLKFSSSKELHIINDNQIKLIKLVDNVWNKIANSSNLIPIDLKSVFSMIREKLSETKRVSSYTSPMIDQVISSCLFLRFICPAIMSPFLFGLANEYSDKVCINRTFTLIAKSIQSLANFSQFPQCKEPYMEFMQLFINKNSNNMRSFLKSISSNKANVNKSPNEMTKSQSFLDSLILSNGYIDIGYHLAELSFQLNIYLKDIPEEQYTLALKDIRAILSDISKISMSVESLQGSLSSQNSNNVFMQTRIPIIYQKLSIENKNKGKSSKTELQGSKSMDSNRRFSLPKKKVDVEENFSFIPLRNNPVKSVTSKKCLPFHTDNYVDFEHCELAIYDEPYCTNTSSFKESVVTKLLNETEINDNWQKVVKECHNISESSIEPIHDDLNNYTFNSSGYQSLSNFSPDDLDNCIIQPSIRYQYNKIDKDPECSLPIRINSPKSTTMCQRNIANRINKNSPSNNKASRLLKNSKDKCGSHNKISQISRDNNADLVNSHEDFYSIDNSSLNSGMSGSKSMLALFAKHNTKNHHFDLSRKVSYGSSDTSLSSKTKYMSTSSQSITNSTTTNNDLDPLIINERKRLTLFFQLFKAQKPTLYYGNAVEQYRQRSNDENTLKSFAESKSQITETDILVYLPAAYKLIKTISKTGKIPTDVVTNYLLRANQKIQMAYISQTINKDTCYPSPELNGAKTTVTNNSLKKTKAHRDLSNLTTQSLPFPISKYSKQSPQSETIQNI